MSDVQDPARIQADDSLPSCSASLTRSYQLLAFTSADLRLLPPTANSAHTTSTSVLSFVRRVSGQRGRLRAFGSGFALGYTSKRCTFLRRMCSRVRTACFGVPSTARRTRVRLRVAVLPKSARPNAVRPAKAPRHAE